MPRRRLSTANITINNNMRHSRRRQSLRKPKKETGLEVKQAPTLAALHSSPRRRRQQRGALVGRKPSVSLAYPGWLPVNPLSPKLGNSLPPFFVVDPTQSREWVRQAAVKWVQQKWLPLLKDGGALWEWYQLLARKVALVTRGKSAALDTLGQRCGQHVSSLDAISPVHVADVVSHHVFRSAKGRFWGENPTFPPELNFIDTLMGIRFEKCQKVHVEANLQQWMYQVCCLLRWLYFLSTLPGQAKGAIAEYLQSILINDLRTMPVPDVATRENLRKPKEMTSGVMAVLFTP